MNFERGDFERVKFGVEIREKLSRESFFLGNLKLDGG